MIPAKVPKRLLRSLQKVNPWVFVAKLVVLGFWMLAGATLTTTQSLFLTFGGVVMIGMGYAHGMELVHSCIHQTATGNRKIDTFIGCLLSWPMFTSYYSYFEGHHRHHKNVGSEEDYESFLRDLQQLRRGSSLTRLVHLLFQMSFLAHYANFFGRVFLNCFGSLESKLRKERPGINPKLLNRIRLEYFFILFFLIAVVALVLLGWQWHVLMWWVIPVLTISGPIHFFIELPEHFDTEYGTRDILRNTRQITTYRIVEYFVNFNNLHAVHHLNGNIPMEKLARFQRAAKLKLNIVHQCSGYLSFYRRFFRDLIQGS